MELTIKRTYFPDATNGELSIAGKLQCYTIELPWKENHSRISCIPEGRYKLTLRYSQRHGTHLLVEDVPARSLILIHASNDAPHQLKGCISTVSTLTGHGTGVRSRVALMKVLLPIMEVIDTEPIYLNIQKN
jgi:hypothetical protein